MLKRLLLIALSVGIILFLSACMAIFDEFFGEDKTVKLTVNIENEEAGQVHINPQQEEYLSGAKITLKADVDNEDEWTFSHWEGDLEDYHNPVTITIEEDTEITAVFSQWGTVEGHIIATDEDGNFLKDSDDEYISFWGLTLYIKEREPATESLDAFTLDRVPSGEQTLVYFLHGGGDPEEIDILVKAQETLDLGKIGYYNDPNYWSDYNTAMLIYINTERDSFSDVDFREAISMAIDKDKIYNKVQSSFPERECIIGNQFIYTEQLGFLDLEHHFDPQLAEQQIEDLNMDGTEIEILTNLGNAPREAVLAELEEDLEDVGLDISAEPIDFIELMDKLFSGDFDVAITGITSPYNPPNPVSLFRSLFHSEAILNCSGFYCTQVDDILDNILTIREESEFLSQLQTVDQITRDSFSTIPLLHFKRMEQTTEAVGMCSQIYDAK